MFSSTQRQGLINYFRIHSTGGTGMLLKHDTMTKTAKIVTVHVQYLNFKEISGKDHLFAFFFKL